MNQSSQTNTNAPLVLKMGGRLLQDNNALDALLKVVAELSTQYPIVLVHGGGDQVDHAAGGGEHHIGPRCQVQKNARHCKGQERVEGNKVEHRGRVSGLRGKIKRVSVVLEAGPHPRPLP